MQSVWKYQLDVTHLQEIHMKAGCEILSIANQNDKITLWAEVDTDRPEVSKTFVIYGTGHEIVAKTKHQGYTKYVGTVQIKEFVWHVYELF